MRRYPGLPSRRPITGIPQRPISPVKGGTLRPGLSAAEFELALLNSGGQEPLPEGMRVKWEEQPDGTRVRRIVPVEE